MSVQGIKMQRSEQWAQHLAWLAVRKLRTVAVAGCWNDVLSPFPLRQHRLKQNPKLRGIFNITVLSYNRPDWLEIFVQFKMLCSFGYPVPSHSSLQELYHNTSKTRHTELPTAPHHHPRFDPDVFNLMPRAVNRQIMQRKKY